MLYPLLTISVYSFATPACVQSRPIMFKTWPKASDLQAHVSYHIHTIGHEVTHLVMVPSISEMTIGVLPLHKYMVAVQVALLTLKDMELAPGFRFKALS